MKTPLILLALASQLFAEQPILERVTPEALAKIRQESRVADLPEKAVPENQIARPKDQSIVRDSTILHDGKNWTIIPKGAIVFLPEALKSRTTSKPVGILLPFLDFLARNPSWITTNEVSFDQAAGNEELPPARIAHWAKQDKLVIAVHQRGPISVQIPKPAPALSQK